MFFQKKKNQEREQSVLQAAPEIERYQNVFLGEKEKIQNLIAPNGIEASNPEYIVLHDAGVSLYGCGLYIDKLPNYLDIASNFSTLFNYSDVTPGVFIEPMLEASKSVVNKRIRTLEGELVGAEKDPDGRNRYRELAGKMQDAEKWARAIESGENTLYQVAFLFWITAESPEQLKNKVVNFEGAAKKKGIELAACYGAHMEAFLSMYPLNHLFSFNYRANGVGVLLQQKIVKWHVMDTRSLSTIYNHTNLEFTHKDGVPLGRNLNTGTPICFDPFDPVHSSYGMVVAGTPGYGKSTALKTLYSRLVDFGYHIVLIDFEPHPSGIFGEYIPLTKRLGGVSYEISNHPNGKRLNIFEVNEEIEYDHVSGRESRAFHLADKIVDISNILLAIATSISITQSGVSFSAEILTRMSAIVTKAVSSMFDERGIHNDDPDSLWESAKSSTVLAAGRVRKKMPTMHEFYLKLLIASATNNDSYKEDAYSLLLDIFEDYVEELYYDPESFREYTREQYESVTPDAGGIRWISVDEKITQIIAVCGKKAYFDCQSNVPIDPDAPISAFDISQVPEKDRPVMTLVCQNFIEEHYIKKNSANPKKAKRLLVSTDEAHKVFPYEGARSYLNALYRVARKRHTAPILIMQSIADLDRYKDTKDILKNTETFILFKHNYSDRDFIKKITNISDSQVDTILALGGDATQGSMPEYVSDGRAGSSKRLGEAAIIEVPSKKTVFMKVEFLNSTEKEIIETNPEEIAKIYKKRRQHV